VLTEGSVRGRCAADVLQWRWAESARSAFGMGTMATSDYRTYADEGIGRREGGHLDGGGVFSGRVLFAGSMTRCQVEGPVGMPSTAKYARPFWSWEVTTCACCCRRTAANPPSGHDGEENGEMVIGGGLGPAYDVFDSVDKYFDPE
jgi:hypothetical protein